MRIWGMSCRVLTAFFCAGIFLVVNAYALDPPVVVKIPCDSPPWMKCTELKDALINGQPTADNPGGGLKALVRQMLDDAYTGKVRLAKNLVNQDDCTTFDNLNQAPICSPLKIPENGCIDETVNAYKMPENTKISSKCPAISKVGAASNDTPLFALGKSDLGSRESSNVAAGLVMAISNQGMTIQNEVNANAFTIEATSPPCYAKATALGDMIKAQSAVSLIEKINACNPASDPTANECSAKQYFAGTLKTMLSAYVQLAQCRLADESTKKFIAFTMDAGSPKSKMYTEVLHDLFVQQCFYPNRGNPGAMRDCYSARYSAWIQQRAAAAFPNVVSACSNTQRGSNSGNGSNGRPVR